MRKFIYGRVLIKGMKMGEPCKGPFWKHWYGWLLIVLGVLIIVWLLYATLLSPTGFFFKPDAAVRVDIVG